MIHLYPSDSLLTPQVDLFIFTSSILSATAAITRVVH